MDTLVGDVHTVQELSVVLSADWARLRDLGAREGKVLVVNTLENQLILEGSGVLNSAAGLECDFRDVLSSQEVLDINVFLVL